VLPHFHLQIEVVALGLLVVDQEQWPTLVIERLDVRRWFFLSNDEVKMVILAKFYRCVAEASFGEVGGTSNPRPSRWCAKFC